jgi:pyruvate dehydrogenase E1 component
VVSVTSWNELARDGIAAEQARLGLTPTGHVADSDAARRATQHGGAAWITELLTQTSGPIIAATDYVRALPEQIRAFVPSGRSFHTLGTDGFGRSDTRAQLREHFGVDAERIVALAMRLQALN